MSCPTSAIAVGAAGVHGGWVLVAGRRHELPQAVAEVLHLAGAQHTAHPQALGSGPWGAQVPMGTTPERLTHGRGQTSAPLGWLVDHRPGCGVLGLQAAGEGPGWRRPAGEMEKVNLTAQPFRGPAFCLEKARGIPRSSWGSGPGFWLLSHSVAQAPVPFTAPPGKRAPLASEGHCARGRVAPLILRVSPSRRVFPQYGEEG